MSAAIEIPHHLKSTPKIACPVPGCAHTDHMLEKHVREAHGLTVPAFEQAYPGQPIVSELGKWAMQRMADAKQPGMASAPVSITKPVSMTSVQQRAWVSKSGSIMKLFGIGIGPNGDRDQPIKTFEGFTAEDGVPAVDEFHQFPKDMRYISMAMETGKGMIYAFGPTGSGKTTLFEQYAARTGRPFGRIQIHAQMEYAELVGTWAIDGSGKMVFQHALLPILMQQPAIILFDEFDSGNPVISAALNAILEGKPLVIPQTGERINLHPDAKLVGTGNTSGAGDATGLYTSTSVQSWATMNRWEMVIELDYLDMKKETEMLKRRYPRLPDPPIENVVKFANVVRTGFKKGEVSVVISTRQLISWLRWYSLTGEAAETYRVAFANLVTGSDRDFIDQAYQRVFAEDPKTRRKAA